jgi:hypothetical protein
MISFRFTHFQVVEQSGKLGAPPEWDLESSSSNFVAGLNDKAWMKSSSDGLQDASTAVFLLHDLLAVDATKRVGEMAVEIQVRINDC